jgi:hypothetical protein
MFRTFFALVLLVPTVLGTAPQPDAAPPPVEALATYLREHARAPEDYVVSLFERRRLVILGERHWVKHDVEFVQRLIPLLHAAGVNTLAIEFACADDQAAADALVTAEAFDLDGARRLLFHANSTWGYVEYIDLYRRAWEVNRARPAGAPPFRIVGLNYAPGWSELREEMTPEQWKKVWHRGTADEYMADTATRGVLDKGAKALVYCGRNHAFTRYRQPETDEANTRAIRFMDRRFGNLLRLRAGDDVCSVMLHAPWRDRRMNAIEPVHGLIDRAFDAAGARPVGFDTPGTPFGDLPDTRSLYSVLRRLRDPGALRPLRGRDGR